MSLPNIKNEHTPPVAPLDASTVMLMRETPSSNPFELLLMRRHARQSFMGKAFVYPGGQLDDADCDPELIDFTDGMTAETAKLRLSEPDLPNKKAIGLFFAAVRETFEESGVLLAGSASGEDIDFTDQKIRQRFAKYRTMIHRQEMTLADLARQENLVFRLNDLRPYARWLTPEVEQKRFNTRFFLAAMPLGQNPVHDSAEMTETLWIEPGKALSKQQAGDMLLMPPTLKTLEEMACQSSVVELLSYTSSAAIQTIMPQVAAEGESIIIKLPHDPEYTLSALKQPHRPDEMSRIVLQEGRFKALKFERQ
ncbi:MAG: NUDIX hydrolase [Thermodesulfobacteriota bacterium]